MLRLRGEPDDTMTDRDQREIESADPDEGFRDHPAFESGSLPDSDGFEDDLDDESERDGRWSILSDTRGLAIAAAAFVPTFALVFFGVPYLLGEPSLARTPGTPSKVASARDPQANSGWSIGKSLSEALRGGPLDRPLAIPTPPPASPSSPPVAAKPSAPSVLPAMPPAALPAPPPVASTPKAPAPSPTAEAPPARNLAPAAPSRGSDDKAIAGRETHSGEPSGEPMPGTSTNTAARSSSGSDSDSSTPSLPPAPSRVPEPERKATASKSGAEPRATHTPRQAATPDSPRSQAEPRKNSGDWTPAAAFADRDAAARLASSIERQGYPVEIRQEASSTRPWVVWIGSQPNGGSRRR